MNVLTSVVLTHFHIVSMLLSLKSVSCFQLLQVLQMGYESYVTEKNNFIALAFWKTSIW